MIGTKLAHYEVTSHLGTGGMGEVYRATDSKLGRSVAIKLLPEAFSRAPDRVRAFSVTRRARARGALRARATGARVVESSQHRGDLRARRTRDEALPGHGTRRRR